MILSYPHERQTFGLFRSRRNDRGVALVIVLAILIVTVLLVVGFLTAVNHDRTASDFYESGTNARQLSDTAVGIVMAQIVDATSKPEQAWISQPGLMRTYSPDGAVAAYKLYSAETMKVNGTYDPGSALSSEVPSGWVGMTNEYVDLNRPVITKIVANAGGVTSTNFPIVDKVAVDVVEGFSVSGDAPTSSDNPLPMPVRWIYVLKDGSLATYSEASKPGAEAVGRIAFWTDDESCKVNLNTASDGVFYDAPIANTQEDHDLGLYQPMAQEYQRYPGHPAETSLAAIIPFLRDTTDLATRSQIAARLTPRIGWGGSEGGKKKAWSTKNPTVSDPDRLMVSTDEMVFARGTSDKSWADGSGNRHRQDLGSASDMQMDISKLPFFATTQSRAPELTLFNRPKITLWPFNQELLSDPTRLTPEDRLIRRASEIGSNKKKLYFQRANAWDSRADYTDIIENQELYSYLQWSTEQKIPSADPSKAGDDTFKDKFGSLGRDQLITSMFDYLRSTVNTLNQAYLPVGGASYSFPQNHTSDQVGFNDITPLVVSTGSGMTKGLGNGSPVLNELILQFYVSSGSAAATSPVPTPEETSYANEASRPEYLIDDSDKVVVDGDGKTPKYVVRKIRMVLLMDFNLVVNNLSSAMPRFQVDVRGGAFGLRPDFISAPTRPFEMRPEHGTAWTGAGSVVSLGFPRAGGDLNLYCSSFAQFDFKEVNVFGGSLGLGYGMVFPNTSNEGQSARTDFRANANNFIGKAFSRVPGYKNYPFFSDIVEIRLPLVVDSDGKAVKNADGTYRTQYEPTLLLNGSTIDITIYPGLVKGATSLTQTSATTGSNYTQKITGLFIENALMPSPLLGSNAIRLNDYSYMFKPAFPTYSELADYSKRLSYQTLNLVMNTPRVSDVSGVGQPATDHSSPMDVFRGYSLDANAGSYGDLRVLAANRDVPGAWYKANPKYSDPVQFHGTAMLGTQQSFSSPTAETIAISNNLHGQNLSVLRSKMGMLLPGGGAYGPSSDMRNASRALDGAIRRNSSGSMSSTMGDVTSGYGNKQDGAFAKGPDVGAIALDLGDSPYFKSAVSRAGVNDSAASTGYFINFAGLLFSPLKQMPSAIKFGTLPARALDTPSGPWETLLFNPVPAGGKDTHRGWTKAPRDHYWLDLFYMPVVEPYALTENLATAGKINLNQQIAPFTYIKRNTGLYALLRNLQVLAIPDTKIATYKSPPSAFRRTSATTDNFRKTLDVAATIKQITDRLDGNDPFVSASEICEIPMLPLGAGTDIDAFWASHRLTGDDQREMPYDHIYPRVTTRSNTFKVYYWTQSLKGKGGKWAITGQSRGAQTIERFLNLDTAVYGTTGGGPETVFPALAGNDSTTGKPYYRFRTVEHKQFAP